MHVCETPCSQAICETYHGAKEGAARATASISSESVCHKELTDHVTKVNLQHGPSSEHSQGCETQKQINRQIKKTGRSDNKKYLDNSIPDLKKK